MAREAEAAEKQLRREQTRQAARDKALEVRRAQMKHVLYTEPEVIKAGSPVTLYYNPNNTNLNGYVVLSLLTSVGVEVYF